MSKKMVFAVVLVFFCFAGIWYLRAQNVADDGSFLSVFIRRFDQIEAKIDNLVSAVPSAKSENKDREILSKLDQVLANQQSILKELEIVKVRATRK